MLQLGRPAPDTPLQVHVYELSDHVRLEFTLSQAYIDYGEAQGLQVPQVPSGSGLTLSGKLPHWLWTALVLTYAPQTPWLAVYQPQWGDKAVIVGSQEPARPVGMLIASTPP